jgi:hypothetical protein
MFSEYFAGSMVLLGSSSSHGFLLCAAQVLSSVDAKGMGKVGHDPWLQLTFITSFTAAK